MTAKFFQHRYGGLYQHTYTGRYTVDGTRVEIYSHLWPFENGIWVRPSPEFWDGRFTEVPFSKVSDARAGNRTEAQEAVTAAKAIAKSAKVEKAEDYKDLVLTLRAWGHASKDPLVAQLLLRAETAVAALANVKA